MTKAECKALVAEAKQRTENESGTVFTKSVGPSAIANCKDKNNELIAVTQLQSNLVEDFKCYEIKTNFNVHVVKVMYTNVRSLFTSTKREELITLLLEHDIDILGLTETWGRSDINDSEMDFAGFKLLRKDHSAVKNKKGCGVSLYVSNKLLSVECDDLTSNQCESVLCKIYIYIYIYIYIFIRHKVSTNS